MFRQQIPNSITLLNLLLGSLAIIQLLLGNHITACWLLAGAGLADLLDGMAARLLKVQSSIGKQLDSLADMVSFGVIPGLIYYILLASNGLGSGSLDPWAIPAFLVTLASAVRLAKFNLDTRQEDGFLGLPTPASALLAIGLLMISTFNTFSLGNWITSPFVLYPVIGTVSALLVSELPLFSLKFKSLNWEGNQIRIIFVLSAVLLITWLREAGLVGTILLYILLSLIFKSNQSDEIPGGN